jgi:hypothetical protein
VALLGKPPPKSEYDEEPGPAERAHVNDDLPTYDGLMWPILRTVELIRGSGDSQRSFILAGFHFNKEIPFRSLFFFQPGEALFPVRRGWRLDPKGG